MMPRWLTLLILAVLGYLVYVGSQSTHAPATPVNATAIPAVTQEEFPALAELTDAERWKRKLNPDYAATMNCSVDGPAGSGKLGFKVVEEVIGTGEAAKCGDTVRIQLTIWNSAGIRAFDEPITLAIGSREVAAGIDAGVVGMKPNGVRTLVLPPQALAHSGTSKAPPAVFTALAEGKVAVVTVKRLK